MGPYDGTIQMKPPQQYIYTVLFIHYVVLTFKCVGKILWCYHSNETSLVILSHGTTYFLGKIYIWFLCVKIFPLAIIWGKRLRLSIHILVPGLWFTLYRKKQPHSS